MLGLQVQERIGPRFDVFKQSTMRIGEIAIVSPAYQVRRQFIQAASDELVIQTEKLMFGRVKINDQLILHLYGLDYQDGDNNPSWDLVSKKLLGYVILYSWNKPATLDSIKDTVDLLLARYRIPVVVAAAMDGSPESAPSVLLNIDFNIAQNSEFTFCNTADRESVRKVLVVLIDSVIAGFTH
ncbi:MAG: hypothetical protein ACE5IY_12570 [bacterium]